MKEIIDLGKLSFKTKLVKMFLKTKLKTINDKVLEVTPSVRAQRGKRMKKVCGKRPAKNVEIKRVEFTQYPAFFYTPQVLADGDWTILYLHGGAYIFSNIEIYNGFVSRFSKELKLKAYSFDYSLAPERPYPHAVDAAVEFYKQIIEHGHKPGKIILAGDSAGGGLSLAAAMKLKKEDIPLPGLIALFSPWVDLTLSGETIRTNVQKDLMVTQNLLSVAANLYADAHDRKDPYISPIFGKYEDFPPVYILTAADELLRSECELLHDILKNSGVDVYLSIWEKAEHALIVGMNMFPESKAVMKNIKDFIYSRCKLTT